MIRKLLLLCLFVSFEESYPLDVILEKPQIQFVNRTFFKFYKANFRRNTRGGPYVMNVDMETVYEAGDNATVVIQLYEDLSGNYVPLAVQLKRKLCDFLCNEQVVGTMLMKQLGENTTCPLPPRHYEWKNVEIHLEKFRWTIPFTYDGIKTRVRIDFKVYKTDGWYLGLHLQLFVYIVQKPRYKQ